MNTEQIKQDVFFAHVAEFRKYILDNGTAQQLQNFDNVVKQFNLDQTVTNQNAEQALKLFNAAQKNDTNGYSAVFYGVILGIVPWLTGIIVGINYIINLF